MPKRVGPMAKSVKREGPREKENQSSNRAGWNSAACNFVVSLLLHSCSVGYMSSRSTSHWLLLVLSLPIQSATARMRNWRTLKALGCAARWCRPPICPSASTYKMTSATHLLRSRTVLFAAATGVVGGSIEDTTGRSDDPLYSRELAARAALGEFTRAATELRDLGTTNHALSATSAGLLNSLFRSRPPGASLGDELRSR